MTKIAEIKPQVQCRPVYVTQNLYEVWYSQPKSLGKIENRKGYWYTPDGHRFISSRDAMGYMLRISNLEVPSNLQVARKKSAVEKPDIPDLHPSPSTQKTRQSATVVPEEVTINQNHPKFQDFLDFQNYIALRKSRQMDGTAAAKKHVDNSGT